MVPLFRRIKNIVREITLAGDTEFIEGKEQTYKIS